jgi:phage anti-repressor protein
VVIVEKLKMFKQIYQSILLKAVNIIGQFSKTIRFYIKKIKFVQRETIIDTPLIDKYFSYYYEKDYIFPFEEVCEIKIFDRNNKDLELKDDIFENIKNIGIIPDSYIYFSDLKYFVNLPADSHSIVAELFPWCEFKNGTNFETISIGRPVLF